MGRFYFLLSIKLGLGAKKDQTSQLAVRRLQVLELRDKCTGSVAGLVSLRGERVAKGIISQLISNAKYFAHARELSFFFFFFFSKWKQFSYFHEFYLQQERSATVRFDPRL